MAKLCIELVFISSFYSDIDIGKIKDEIIIRHIYREGNKEVDAAAKVGAEVDGGGELQKFRLDEWSEIRHKWQDGSLYAHCNRPGQYAACHELSEAYVGDAGDLERCKEARLSHHQ